MQEPMFVGVCCGDLICTSAPLKRAASDSCEQGHVSPVQQVGASTGQLCDEWHENMLIKLILQRSDGSHALMIQCQRC